MSLAHPQAFLRLSGFLLQPFWYHIPRRILPIPPTPAVFDERVIDVGATGEEHIDKRAPVLVEAVSLKRHVLTKDQLRSGLLRSLAVGLVILRAVNPAEPDTLGVLVVQDFDGVTINHTD